MSHDIKSLQFNHHILAELQESSLNKGCLLFATRQVLASSKNSTIAGAFGLSAIVYAIN